MDHITNDTSLIGPCGSPESEVPSGRSPLRSRGSYPFWHASWTRTLVRLDPTIERHLRPCHLLARLLYRSDQYIRKRKWWSQFRIMDVFSKYVNGQRGAQLFLDTADGFLYTRRKDLDTPEDFVLFDGVTDDGTRMIVFSTPRNLKVLGDNRRRQP